MTLTLSRRDVLLLVTGLSLGCLLGIGAGAVIVGGNLPAEMVAGLISLGLIIIGGVGTIVKLLIDRIIADLQHNTRLTSEVLGAATDAANHSEERVQLRNDLQEERWKREAAERALHLIEVHPSCIGCRQAVNDVLNQWRTVRKPDTGAP